MSKAPNPFYKIRFSVAGLSRLPDHHDSRDMAVIRFPLHSEHRSPIAPTLDQRSGFDPALLVRTCALWRCISALALALGETMPNFPKDAPPEGGSGVDRFKVHREPLLSAISTHSLSALRVVNGSGCPRPC